MTPDREALIRAEWARQGIPTDTMDGGYRPMNRWVEAAFDAGYAAGTWDGLGRGKYPGNVAPKEP